MKYLISISYDGSKFHGFQRLNNLDTVQKKLEEALTIINKEKVEIKGSGRTDRGVHALDQKASFNLNFNIEPSHLKKALNSLVKPYIYITDVKQVNENFHARYNVLKKEYIYKINLGVFNPRLVDYMFEPNYKLNIKAMKKCSELFVGTHNFQNFIAGKRNNYKCPIYDIKFKIKNNILEIKFTGNHFYRYMVRNLVGAMLDVGRGITTIKEVKEALDNPNLPRHFQTAIPEGLYLTKIIYKNTKK